jgi:hypothetical protein
MASRRPETIAKREREQARREKRERKQAKKEARALGVPQVTAETADGETPDGAQHDAAGGEPTD